MPSRGPKPGLANFRRAPGPFAPEDFAPATELSARAVSEYRRLTEVLATTGLLSRTDPRLIELYAVNYDLLLAAQSDINRDGASVMTPSGYVRPHPMVDVLASATQRLRGLMVDLGLTPGAARDEGGAPAADDQWGGMLDVVA